jgi:hypothetical protein
MLAQLNWLAVIGATIVAFVIAFVWYLPPVFGLRWATLIKGYTGLTDQALGAGLPRKVILWVIGFLVNAIVVALLVRALGIGSASDAILLGVLLWLGIGATFSSWPPIHANQPWGVYAINNGAFLLQQLAMAVILTVWK